MKKSNFWILSILCVLFVFSSCSKKEDPVPQPINQSEVLAAFLESTSSPLGKDYVNTDMPSIISASDVKVLNETGQIYIMDIRSAADYALGHIENAVNVAAGDVWTHIKAIELSNYQKVAIVCYTGQTAGWATSLLRLLGYDKVFSMKWGMCSWNSEFASKWQNAIGNTYASQFTADQTAKGPAVAMPTISTGQTTGPAILEARVNAILTEGFGAAKVDAATVFGNLANYYIANYWNEVHYLDPGHIPGAMQYTPKSSLKLSEYLKTLPNNKTVVVYCYTGQNSAFLTAYLRLLGYDCKSLLYGANSMIYDKMVAADLTVFNDDQIMEYPYVQ